MKLIDIMKRYNKCILKENAKLRSIYNALIRESGADGEETDECDACGDPSCKDGEKCGAKPANECDATDECDTITLEEFLGEKEEEDGEGGKPAGKKPAGKKPADDEDDEDGKPKDKPADGEAQDECELEEEEEVTELMDAETFFNGGKKKAKPVGEDEEGEEGGETNESMFSAHDFYQNVSEQYKKRPEAALGESLRRHYKKANRRLFNF